MQFDLGLQGLGILVALSLGFGVIAQVVLWRVVPRWLWLVGAAGYLVGGLFVSEVMFATYTVDEIQPIVDGLAFDEALLGGVVTGLVVVLVTWFLTRSSRSRRPTSA